MPSTISGVTFPDESRVRLEHVYRGDPDGRLFSSLSSTRVVIPPWVPRGSSTLWEHPLWRSHPTPDELDRGLALRCSIRVGRGVEVLPEDLAPIKVRDSPTRDSPLRLRAPGSGGWLSRGGVLDEAQGLSRPLKIKLQPAHTLNVSLELVRRNEA